MNSILSRYRLSLGFFIVGLLVSGMTTFPLKQEVSLLNRLVGPVAPAGQDHTVGLQQWIRFVDSGVHETYFRFPFFAYATDWLGFGHFVIAAFFILPLANPVKYRAVLLVGLAACAGVLVVAFVCGTARGIPFGWQLVDCGFGVIGAIPLLYCLRLTTRLDRVSDKTQNQTITAGSLRPQ